MKNTVLLAGACENSKCFPTSTKYSNDDFDIPKVVKYKQFISQTERKKDYL